MAKWHVRVKQVILDLGITSLTLALLDMNQFKNDSLLILTLMSLSTSAGNREMRNMLFAMQTLIQGISDSVTWIL